MIQERRECLSKEGALVSVGADTGRSDAPESVFQLSGEHRSDKRGRGSKKPEELTSPHFKLCIRSEISCLRSIERYLEMY